MLRIATILAAVAGIQQQLPSDPKMDGNGNVQQRREMLWKQGARKESAAKYRRWLNMERHADFSVWRVHKR